MNNQLFWILISVFGMCSSIIAYFLKENVKRLDKIANQVSELTTSLTFHATKTDYMEKSIVHNTESIEDLRKRCHGFISKFNVMDIKLERLKHVEASKE